MKPRGEQPKRKKRTVPENTQAFCEYIRSLSGRINRLRAHLKVATNDIKAKDALQVLIRDRLTALRSRPYRVDLRILVELCRQLKLHKEMGIRAR